MYERAEGPQLSHDLQPWGALRPVREEVIADMRRQIGSDVPVIDIQSEKNLFRSGRIEFWPGALGYQRGMLKSWQGRVLALIVVPATISGHLNFWTPKIETSIENFYTYVELVQKFDLQLENSLISFGQLPDANQPLAINIGKTVAAIVPNAIASYNLTDTSSPQELILWQVTHPEFLGTTSDGRAHFDVGISHLPGDRIVPMGYPVSSAFDLPIDAVNQAVSSVREQLKSLTFYDEMKAHMLDKKIPLRRLAVHKISYKGRVRILDQKEMLQFAEKSHSRDGPSYNWYRSGEHPILACKSAFGSNGWAFFINHNHPDLEAENLQSHFFKVKVA